MWAEVAQVLRNPMAAFDSIWVVEAFLYGRRTRISSLGRESLTLQSKHFG